MPFKDPEKRKQYLKEYRDKNIERDKKKQAEYRASGKYKKTTTISGWKYKGLIADDYDAIYERWTNTTHCDCCRKAITSGKASKVMDHCHKTGKFRNILCHHCNILRFHLENNYQAYLRMLTL